MFTTPSQVSSITIYVAFTVFRLPALLSLQWSPHCCLRLNALLLVVVFNLFTQIPKPLPSVSMSLFLFCLLVYFVHYTPHTSEIVWYLYFTHWLISHGIILSRSIHAIPKGKISFFPTAKYYSIV